MIDEEGVEEIFFVSCCHPSLLLSYLLDLALALSIFRL